MFSSPPFLFHFPLLLEEMVKAMTRHKLLCWLAFLVNSFGRSFPAQLGEGKCHVSSLFGNCTSSVGKFECYGEILDNKCVNVANTNVTSLSSNMWTRNVSHIYAYRNRIRVFDIDDPEILTHIDVSHNQLKLLPVDLLSEAKNLIYLNLAHNNLQNISSDSLRENIFLKILDLSYNELTDLAEEAFSKMEELERLFLKGNRLSSLPKNIFENCTNLERLNLASNVIENLVEGTFNKLEKLKSLDLSDNRLKQLPFLGHMPKLYVLDVSKNILEFVEVQELPRLFLFILKNNKLPELECSMFPKGVQEMGKVDLRFNRFSSVNVTILLEFYDPRVNSVLLDGNPWACKTAICPLVQTFPSAHVWFQSDPRCSGPKDMAGKFLDSENVIRRVCRVNHSVVADQTVALLSNVDITKDDEYYSLSSTSEAISMDVSLDTVTDSTTYSTNEGSESDTSSYSSLTDESTLSYQDTLNASTTVDEEFFNSTTYSTNEGSESDTSSNSSLTDESTLSYQHTVNASTTVDEESFHSTTYSTNEGSESDTSSNSSLTDESTLSYQHTVNASTTVDEEYFDSSESAN